MTNTLEITTERIICASFIKKSPALEKSNDVSDVLFSLSFYCQRSKFFQDSTQYRGFQINIMQ